MPTGGFTLPPKTLASIDISEAAAAGMKRVVVLDDNTIAVVDDQGNAHPAADLSSAVLKDDLGTPGNPAALDEDGVLRGIVSVRTGTKAEIDALVLAAGETAIVRYTTASGVKYSTDIRSGDGETLGGIPLLDHSNDFRLLSGLSGEVNDLDLSTPARAYSVQTPYVTITGIDASKKLDTPWPKRFYIVKGSASGTLTFSHLSASSSSSNQLRTSTGENIVLSNRYDMVEVVHANRWYVRKF